MMEHAASSEAIGANDGINYCMWGVAALVVGLLIFGIPCGLLAAHLGGEGVKHGATTFGAIVKLGGWAEVIMTILGIVVIAAGHSGMH